jgi:molecular chaperone DnaJ
MEFKDYYKILGVPKNATEKEIKQAYRRLARQYHPDVNPGNKEAEERFKEINEAYQVLSDPKRRAEYDQFGADWARGGQYAQQAWQRMWERAQQRARQQGSQPGMGFGGFGFEGSGFSDFFEMLFGRGGLGGFGGTGGMGEPGGFTRTTVRQQAAPREIEQDVEITLEEAYRGVERSFRLQFNETCSTCRGFGLVGIGACSSCRGTGVVPRRRELTVRIPPGAYEGLKLRVPGEATGGSPGSDVYFKIHVQPHPVYERKGDDLYMEVAVPLTDAVLGGEVEVTTLSGRKTMRIPPETQNGQTFRLAGEGMPRLRGGGKGDLYVKVRVLLPTNLSQRERELFKELRALRSSYAGARS